MCVCVCVCVCGGVTECVVVQETCYQYWPSSGSQTFGEFTVELLGEEQLSGFSIRNFSLINNKVCLTSDWETLCVTCVSLSLSQVRCSR